MSARGGRDVGISCTSLTGRRHQTGRDKDSGCVPSVRSLDQTVRFVFKGHAVILTGHESAVLTVEGIKMDRF